MSLPFYKFVPITGSVVAPAFTTEKKHALLATTNSLISSGDKYLVYSGMSALTNFAAELGSEGADYQLRKSISAFFQNQVTAYRNFWLPAGIKKRRRLLLKVPSPNRWQP